MDNEAFSEIVNRAPQWMRSEFTSIRPDLITG
jgi:hypothetical protein